MTVENSFPEEDNNPDKNVYPGFGPDMNPESDPLLGPDPEPDEAIQGCELMNTVSAISKRVDELERAVRTLPHMDEDGTSECPFAEELYAQKEELEQQVASDIEVLHGYLAELDKDIERCKRNLARIQADSAQLNLKEPQDCYVQAELEQQKEYRDAVADREQVYTVLLKAEAILKISQRKKYPGKEPQKQHQSPVSFPGHVLLPLPESQSGTLGKEAEGLISLGPLGETQRSSNPKGV